MTQIGKEKEYDNDTGTTRRAGRRRMSAPDISRDRCNRSTALMAMEGFGAWADLVLALRAALDAAERERDEARSRLQVETWNAETLNACCENLKVKRDAADATGYARGVRDAMKLAEAERLKRLDHENLEHVGAYRAVMALEMALLALLPKEKNDV